MMYSFRFVRIFGLLLLGAAATGCASSAVKSADPIKITSSDIRVESGEKGQIVTIRTKDGLVKYEVVDKTVPVGLQSYKLGCGDALVLLLPRIGDSDIPVTGNYVVDLEEFAGVEYTRYQVTVDPMGNINLPMIGEVCVAGLSVKTCEQVLKTKLRDYFVHPGVVVKVANYSSYSISVYGEVRNPGRFEIKKPITLSEALALAGGVNADGSLKKVYVGRRSQKSYKMNLEEIWYNAGLDSDVVLERDDTVFVPREDWFRMDKLLELSTVLSNFSVLYLIWK